MSTRLDEAELEAELQRIRAEKAAKAEEDARRLAQAQDAWDRRLIAEHKHLDARIEEEGKRAQAQAEEAIRRGDLSTAAAAFIRARASRKARYQLRNLVAGAEQRAQTGTNVLPAIAGLSDRGLDFLEYVNEVIQREYDLQAWAWAEDVTGQRPVSLADLEQGEPA